MMSMIAVGVLVVHAVWCMLYKRVSDGVMGKVLYGLLSLAALSYLSTPDAYAASLLHASLAAIAVRHFWMKTYWPSLRERIMRKYTPSESAARELPPRRR